MYRGCFVLLIALGFASCTVRNVTASDGLVQSDGWKPPGDGRSGDHTVGRDGPTKLDGGKSCSFNGHCGQKEYCALPSCTASSGTCTLKPGNCQAIYAPVCGCDEKTYGNDCEAAAAGVSVSHKGQCCADINAKYQELVKAAKKCCALCAQPDPCLKTVYDRLDCPCITTVNANAPELAGIQTLDNQWVAQGCKATGCPPMPCPNVTGGSCQPTTGTSGMCVDISR
jgi:hypothetical protein